MANFRVFMFVFVIASAHLINHSASSEKSNLAYAAGFLWKLTRNFVPTPSPCGPVAPVVGDGDYPDYPDHEVPTDAPTDSPADASIKATKDDANALEADAAVINPEAEGETPAEVSEDASPTEAPTDETATDEQPAE